MKSKEAVETVAVEKTPEVTQDLPVLVGKVFNGTIQVFGAPFPNVEAAKEVLGKRKNDGVFVVLPIIEL